MLFLAFVAFLAFLVFPGPFVSCCEGVYCKDLVSVEDALSVGEL